jgi:glucose-1-phosphatase
MKTILFDFGNVVAHFDHMRAMHRLRPYTATDPATLFRIIYGGPEEDAYEHGHMTTAEFIRFAKTACNIECTDAEFLAVFVDIFMPNPDVVSLLPALASRYRLVLASNTNDAHFTHYSAQLADALRVFAYLGASHRLGHRKPNRGFFETLQPHTLATPEECVFVDDLPENIAAAERHGWRGVLYRPGDRLMEKLRGIGVQFADATR